MQTLYDPVTNSAVKRNAAHPESKRLWHAFLTAFSLFGIVLMVLAAGQTRAADEMKDKPPGGPEAKPKTDKDAPKPAEPVLSNAEKLKRLEVELAQTEDAIQREDRKHKQQMSALQRAKGSAITGTESDGIAGATQAIEEEKNRHNERLNDLSTRWSEIKAEVDGLKADVPKEEKKE